MFIKSKNWESLLKKTKILQYFMNVYAVFPFFAEWAALPANYCNCQNPAT